MMANKNPVRFDYPTKILVAWGEAISGNGEIRDWLMQNGYPELGLFTFALNNDEKALEWLIKNNFPHLAALINGMEGNKQALQWLSLNNFEMLKSMALAGDNDKKSTEFLMQKDKLLAMLAIKMGAVKNEIESDNNDAHKISKG
jgi:hypothetical protein